MRKQKFFCVDIEYINSTYILDRGLLESWLQFFTDTDLKGRALAEYIGSVKLQVYWVDITHRVPDYGVRWWEGAFAVTRMQSK